MTVKIIIDHDKVEIEGTTILRPSRIAPSQWLAYWELFAAPPKQ